MSNCFSNSAIEACLRRRLAGIWQALILLGGVLLIVPGCTDSSPPPDRPSVDPIGAGAVYVFAPDSQDYLATPQLFPLEEGMSPDKALAALGDHLGRTYFRSEGSPGDPGIRFEVLGVHRLPVATRAYRLAVINMLDPRGMALEGFFQGSAGGLTSYYLLAATFLQPHREPPLVDGFVLLYNGEEFPEMDHVNLRGIVTPDAVRPVVTKVLYRYRPAEPAADG